MTVAVANRPPSSGSGLHPTPSSGFVLTPSVQAVVDRALTYLELGYPVHLSGPAGIGKTTLALHIASMLARPVSLLHGSDEHRPSDLVGRYGGMRRKRVVDNFISSVVKQEDRLTQEWVDERLTVACKEGHTLLYDEFTRSRAEANNVLLSVLEEGVLTLPMGSRQEILRVHPDFRVVFTSNPEEYAGTHRSQDALMDRMVTIDMDHYDRLTEVAIVEARTGLAVKDAAVVVDLVRDLRVRGGNPHRPTLRAALMVAKVLRHKGARARGNDAVFHWAAMDVLANQGAAARGAGASTAHVRDALNVVLTAHGVQ